MYIFHKKLLSVGLALYLILSPAIATASPHQEGRASIASSSVSFQSQKQKALGTDSLEALAVAAINSADEEGMGEVLVANAKTLGLVLTNYNLLTDQSPVHQALVGKKFRNKSAVKRAFDSAVTKELKKEVAEAEVLAVNAVNSANADEMEAVITANAQTLGLDLNDYTLLMNKVPVHQALVQKRFRNASSVRRVFKSAVAKEKKAETIVAEALAVKAINNATADEMGAEILDNAQTLSLDLKDYTLLSNRSAVDIAMVGRNFKNKSAVNSRFKAAVAAEKLTEKKARAAAIAKIDKIAKGASAAGITIQDLLTAGVNPEDVIEANLTLYQVAISEAANYALNSTAKIQQMVNNVNTPTDKLAAAQKVVAALFTDETKTALADGVDQAKITAALEIVSSLDDGIAEKAGLLADVQAAQTLLENRGPLINDVSSIPGAVLGKDTLKLSFSKLTKTSGIGVSNDCKMTIETDGLGLIGDFDLTMNHTNSLLKSPLPENLLLTNANFAVILEAIKGSDSATKLQVLDEADFATLFEHLKQIEPDLKDAVLKGTDFNNLYSTVKNSDPETSQRILGNIIAIMDLASNDPHKSEFKTTLISAFLNILPVLTTGQQQILFAYLQGGTTTNLTDLFNSLQLTDAQKKDILSRLDYTKLFNGVLLLEQETRIKIFDVLDFTDILYNVKSSDSVLKVKVYEEVLSILDMIKESNISKVDILNSIALENINKAAFFKVLDNLDGHITGLVTMEATLTDNQNRSSNYTIYLNP